MLRTLVILSLATGMAACSSARPDAKTDPANGAILASAGDATDSGRKSTAATLGIPPGHLPPPGQCKVWMPGEPPGQQKKKYTAGDCSRVRTQVPPGGWLVYRPTADKKEVQVSVYGANRADVVAIRFFDIASGALLREEPGS